MTTTDPFSPLREELKRNLKELNLEERGNSWAGVFSRDPSYLFLSMKTLASALGFLFYNEGKIYQPADFLPPDAQSLGGLAYRIVVEINKPKNSNAQDWIQKNELLITREMAALVRYVDNIFIFQEKYSYPLSFSQSGFA